MPRFLLALWLIGHFAHTISAQDKPKEANPPRETTKKLEIANVLKTLQNAYAQTSAPALLAMTTADFQRNMTPANLGAVLGAWKARYGKWDDQTEEVRQAGAVRVFKIKAERGVLHLRLTFDDSHYLQGIGLGPAFLDNLPATIDLSAVEQRLSEAALATLTNYKVPSISLALVKGDQLIWSKAFGYQNLGRRLTADANTVYGTGSILKVVVATALMQQVDAGKLDLDAPVEKYLHGLQVPNPFEKERPLTARHLLSHHGGIANGAQMVRLWRRELPATLDEVVHKRVKVNRKPGEAFQYSNYGFALNGYLLAKLRETSFERALGQGLLEPLGMRETVFEPVGSTMENLAVPYENSSLGSGPMATPFVRLDVQPAGDAYSTPSDMARFLIPHMNDGKYQGKQILSAWSVHEMATIQYGAQDARSGVGLGWMVNNVRGRKLLWHNGAVPGFFTYIAINPEKKSGVVLFCNKYNPLEGGLGLLADPLVDLRELSIELLDRLAPAVPAKAVTKAGDL